MTDKAPASCTYNIDTRCPCLAIGYPEETSTSSDQEATPTPSPSLDADPTSSRPDPPSTTQLRDEFTTTTASRAGGGAGHRTTSIIAGVLVGTAGLIALVIGMRFLFRRSVNRAVAKRETMMMAGRPNGNDDAHDNNAPPYAGLQAVPPADEGLHVVGETGPEPPAPAIVEYWKPTRGSAYLPVSPDAIPQSPYELPTPHNERRSEM